MLTAAHIRFPLVIPYSSHEHSPLQDIYLTTQYVVKYCVPKCLREKFGDEKEGILRNIMKACHRRDVDLLKSAISDFNTLLVELKSQGVFAQEEATGISAGYSLVCHILEQSYARTVAPDADSLRDYKSA